MHSIKSWVYSFYLSFSVRPFKVFYVPLDGNHGNPLGTVDVVPDTEIGPVLCHTHVTHGNPLSGE